MARKKKEKIERSNDEIREIILSFFYDIHKNASTPKKMHLKIIEIKSRLKESGLKSKEITSNLDYLIQTGFIVREEEVSQIKTGKGVFPSKKTYYKASDKTINHFEGISKFQKLEKSFAGINITNINGVTILGDGNTVVNTNYTDLYKELSLLSDVVRKSDQLADEDKLNYIAEIETIKSQLMKPTPDKNIIKQVWEKLKPLATVSGIITLFEKVAGAIGPVIGALP